MNNVKKLAVTAMLFAVGMVLPFFIGQIPAIGKMLLPMHIPVLLCGFIVGWQYGALIGFLLPIVRGLVFGMPPLYPNAVAMAFEMAAYGFVSGYLYSHARWQCTKMLYISLVTAMLAGRIVWAFAEVILLGIGGNTFTWEMFATGAFLNAIPGIIVQLVLIPLIMVALRRAKVVPLWIGTENKSGVSGQIAEK
ncbi:MAG TPA: ECF transporter S component [Eubacterium sp.]|nr:ECF transporter S component [Eubacterium sp.]HAZ85253.1 ECF transporter S component [Eubacterium sp.]